MRNACHGFSAFGRDFFIRFAAAINRDLLGRCAASTGPSIRSNMKIDDSALSSYLVEHLQPLTKADPNLLAKYVAALLKNNKPKKELETLCVDKLFDFLGDESKPFVKNLFCAFEDGTISTFNDECETTAADIATTVPVSGATKIAGKAMCRGDITDSRNCSHLSYANTGMFIDPEEEGTDEEDDDRNHKHRRRASRSQSFDREVQDCSFNKVNKPAINGHSMYDTNHSTVENLECLNANHMNSDGQPKRLLGRDHAYGRLGGDVNQCGVLRGASFFRGDGWFEHQDSSSRGVLGRGRGAPAEPWAVREQRTALDGLDFNLPLIPLGPPSFIPYSGRSSSSRGNISRSPWAGFGQSPGISNSSLDQALPLNGFSTNSALGLTGGRLRCSDFEERGYCLRGDLCPMEHGANRIVVEDVQGLSQFNLPLTLPSGRGGMTFSSMSVSTSSLSPYSSNPSIAARDSNLTVVNKPNVSNGISTSPGPDVYDPDQPFLNREQPTALVAGLKRLPSFRKDPEGNEEEVAVLKRHRGQSPNEGNSVNVTPQGLTPGQPFLNHFNQGDSNAESSTRPRSSFLNQSKAQKREFVEDYEPQSLAGMQENSFNEEEERSVKSSRTKVGVSSVFQKEAGLHFSENINHTSGSKRNVGLGSERAQRTLYVGCIPSNNNRKELLKAHFQKFGEVVDIRVPSQGDRAFVQFSRRNSAEAALKSPEAVMGNRFIRLSWAKRDSLPIVFADGDPVLPSTTGRNMSIGLGDSLGLITEASSMKTKHQAVTVSAAAEPVAFKTAGRALAQSVSPVSSTALPRKQEELELMKEELKRKQDELAQKRDDFRRKLDRLSKQGSGIAARLYGNQVNNLMSSDVKVDIRGNQSSSKQLILDKIEAGIDNSQKEISALSASIEKALLSTDQSTSGVLMDPVKVSLGLTQSSTGSSTPLSQRGSRGHSPWPGGTGLPSQWGPMRYKLDNRTTTFRVLPPFPDGLPDVTSLKDHFSLFGDLSNVELEDVDKKVQGFKVTFYTRSAAEQAFLQGRSYQGASLCFSWAKPSSGTTTGVSSTGNIQIDSINDNSSQTFCEAPVELGSSEAKLPKTLRTLGGNGSRLDAIIEVSDDILEPVYSEVAENDLHSEAETYPTLNTAGAGSMSGPYKVASSL